MDPYKIKLPDFQIAELYKRTLVDIDTGVFSTPKENLEIEPEAISAKDTIKYIGENRKQVIIIVNQPEEAHIKENDLSFLTTVLKACNLSLADIAIVNTAAQEVTFTLLKEQLGVAQLIMFDVEPSAIKLPFMIPTFQVQKYNDCSVLMAPSLTALNEPTPEGKLLKTKLWMSLKQIFGIV